MQVKAKIQKYYSKEEYVTIASGTNNELLKAMHSSLIVYSLGSSAAQRLMAMCELIRATSFKYAEWRKWYFESQKDNLRDIDLHQFISRFGITIIQQKDDSIIAIKSFANYYKAVLGAEISYKDDKPKEQFLNDYSLSLCVGELQQFSKLIENEKIDDPSANLEKNLQDVFQKLFNANNIKRVAIEKELLQMLTPERFRVSALSPDDFEVRNPFESDYFRIVTSAPIRRLQDKTQIFPQEKSDFVRRRLTHSMEVAAIGRQLGLMVEEQLIESGALFKNQEYVKHYSHAMAAILETAGLVHDIGNPPFGHFGEDTIQRYFSELIDRSKVEKTLQAAQVKFEQRKNKDEEQALALSYTKVLMNERQDIGLVAKAFANLTDEQQTDFTRFDGNVQGLRILRHLGLSSDHDSFNLTMPTMATIIKYPFPSKHDRIPDNHSSEKYGYYQSEKEAYDKICETLHLKNGKRHPLSYLLEAADDIVNVTSDVEDGFKMGIISYEDIQSKMETLGIEDLKFDTIRKYAEEQAKQGECCVEISNELVVKEFRIRAVHRLMKQAVKVFVDNIHDIIYDSFDNQGENSITSSNSNPVLGNELLKDDDLRNALSKLQKNTYRDTYVLKSELLGEHVITTMLDKFIGCMFSEAIKEKEENGKKKYILGTKTVEGKLYALISPNYKRAFNCNENEVPAEPYHRFLLAVDHVSGMTDSYIVDLYNELTNRKR